MGAWGPESCSSDHCWDALKAKNIHKITTAETKDSLDSFEFPIKDPYDAEAYVGVVIWGLRHGCSVERLHLVKAAATARRLMKAFKKSDEDFELTDRHDALQEEILDIGKALANNGIIKPKHVKGLFERMNDKLEEAEKS